MDHVRHGSVCNQPCFMLYMVGLEKLTHHCQQTASPKFRFLVIYFLSNPFNAY